MQIRNLLIILSTLALASACSSDRERDGGGSSGRTDATVGDGDLVDDVGPATDGGDLDAGVGLDGGGARDAGGSSCTPPGPAIPNGQYPLPAPVRRGDMAAAYDPSCDRVMMFFGDKAEPVQCGPAPSDFLPDGWAFDPAINQWYEIDVTAGPAPMARARSHGAWDGTRNRMIVFGGRWRSGSSGSYTWLNDVWAFDIANNTWTELSPQGAVGAPDGRMNSVMVADPTNDRIILHAGGQVASDFLSFIVEHDTWEFDLATNTWTEIGTGGTNFPTPRLFHMGALDSQRSRFYIFGGGGADAFTATSFFRDLWYLDLTTDQWTQIPTDSGFPAGRIKGMMDYDAGRDRIVLFAGHDDTRLGNNNDLWTFNTANSTWTEEKEGDTFNAPAIAFCDFPADFTTVDQTSPERRESHLFVIHDTMAYMFGGRTDCGLSNDTWSLSLPTLDWAQLNTSPNGMTCFRGVNPNCSAAGARMCD